MQMSTGSAQPVQNSHGVVATASLSRTPQQIRAAKRRRHKMMLYLAVGLLRDRRFRKDAMTAAIVLAVLARLARDSQTQARTRLADWWKALPGPGDRAQDNERPALTRAS